MRSFLCVALASCVCFGCVASGHVNLSVASPREVPADVIILEQEVSGEDCPGWIGSYGSYAAAIDDALSKVEAANALVNVRFSRREMPVFRICVTVEGDAAKL
jgi:hypothetical protein